MSDLLLPTLPGRDVEIVRTLVPPKVTIHTTPSEREYRARSATTPRYSYTLQYNVLRMDEGELQALVGFFARHGGTFETFLFQDPDDNTAADEIFGITDGSTTTFQLLRSFGGFAEPIYNLASAPVIKRGGTVVASGYSVSALGAVTFSSPGAAGQVLTWSGGFYRRVRFDTDTLDTTRFAIGFYKTGRLRLLSSKNE